MLGGPGDNRVWSAEETNAAHVGNRGDDYSEEDAVQETHIQVSQGDYCEVFPEEMTA